MVMPSKQELLLITYGHEPSWDRMIVRKQDSNGNVIVVCNVNSPYSRLSVVEETMLSYIIIIMRLTVTATEKTHR